MNFTMRPPQPLTSIGRDKVHGFSISVAELADKSRLPGLKPSIKLVAYSILLGLVFSVQPALTQGNVFPGNIIPTTRQPTTLAPGVGIFAGSDPALARGGGLATETPLGRVSGVAVDSAGNVYFGDVSQRLVMRVSRDRLLTVFAGNGALPAKNCPEGDGGPATEVPLYPGPLTVNGSGALFIADDSRIRKVTPDGVIRTVLDGRERLPGSGLHLALTVWFPGLALDSKDRLYFSESIHSRIWRLDPDDTLTVVAGNGTYAPPSGDGGPATEAVLGEPHGIAVDDAGNIFIADFRWGRIRKVSATDGTIQTIAGGGTSYSSAALATDAILGSPESIVLDQHEDLVISVPFGLTRISNDGMLFFSPFGGAGFGGDGGPVSQAQFTSSSEDLALDSAGNLYFPDGDNGRLRRIDLSGIVTTIAGNGNYRFGGDGGPASKALLNAPNYVSFDPTGYLYISDAGNHRVRRVSVDGIIETAAGNGMTRPLNATPVEGAPALETPLGPMDAATGSPDGGFYFSEWGLLRKVDQGGTASTVAGGGLYSWLFPATDGSATDLALTNVDGLALGPDGLLYFDDEASSVIRRLNRNGTFVTVVGKTSSGGFAGDGGPAGVALLSAARGLTVVPEGTGMSIYFADGANGRVRKVGPNGTIVTIAGNGDVGFKGDGGLAVEASLFYPQAVAVDTAMYVYIADWGNHRIRRVSPSGIITTLVDGLYFPSGLALGGAGDLFIADTGNNRILRVTNPQQ